MNDEEKKTKIQEFLKNLFEDVKTKRTDLSDEEILKIIDDAVEETTK